MIPQLQSFRLWNPPPAKVLDGTFTEQERLRFKNLFKASARRYTLWGWITLGSFGVIFVSLILAIRQISYPAFGWVVGFAVFVFVSCLLGQPMLQCPACNQLLGTKSLGGGCPQCGGLLKERHCSTCQRTFSEFGRGRGYTLRYCTNCRLKLHDAGI